MYTQMMHPSRSEAVPWIHVPSLRKHPGEIPPPRCQRWSGLG